jgi:heme-degrading monooxygenase HmoA
MFRAVISMKVKAGREADFERAWETIAQQVRSAPGNLRQSLARDPSDNSTYVLTSDWQSREQFHDFERSPEQDALTAPLRELREAARMNVYHLLKHVEGA